MLSLVKAARLKNGASHLNATSSALDSSMSKLELVLNEENQALESQQPADHDLFTMKKNHILRELMIYQRADKNGTIVSSKPERLTELTKLIELNKRLLSAQISAMSEITNFLTQAAIAEGEDGTYTRKM